MSIIDKVRNLSKKTSPEKLAEDVAISFNERKENGEEHPIDSTVEEIIDIIKKNQNLDITRELLRNVLERQEILDRVFVKASTKISEIPEIPDNVITQVVQETDAEVPDKVIDTIIEEGKINSKERLKLIQNVEDKQIKEKRVKDELKRLYNECESKKDGEVAERINEIKGILQDDEISAEIQELIRQVVARKMAENCYSKFGGTKIYELSRAMPVEEMMDKDLPNLVLKEYKKIVGEEGLVDGEGFFSKTNLEVNVRRQILNQMAGDIVRTYRETNILAVPQSNSMKKLTSDEEEMFIRIIKNTCCELSEEQIQDLRLQIRGNVSGTKVKENMLISKIKSLTNKNGTIDLFMNLLDNDQTIKTLKMLEETKLLERLNAIPEEKRKESIGTVAGVIGKRELAEQTIKLPGSPEVKIYGDCEEFEGR